MKKNRISKKRIAALILSVVLCLLLIACEKRTPATVIIEPAETVTDTASKSALDYSYYITEIPDGQELKVQNQGDLGACWAFAANTTLSYSMLDTGVYNFSADHMLRNNGYGLDIADGGDYTMSMGYYTSWKGPVLEEDDPYGDDITNDNAKPAAHVQEIQILEDKDYQEIKQKIFEYGAVESSIYVSMTENNYIDLTYYNESKCSYCYTDGNVPNHEVCIIGWDDDYPMENFNMGAERNGAFICVNSWGSDFGKNGIFYVSYDDALIGTMCVAYTDIESANNYNYIYQHDSCGWTGRSGFGDSSAYFANVFSASGAQELRAVGFYATEKNTSYRVLVCSDYNGVDSLDTSGKTYAEGMLDNAGYYTIYLNESVPLRIGGDFAVIVEINTPGEEHPIAVEMRPSDGRDIDLVTAGKKSYISANGSDWENTQETSDCNVCLKAYTTNG